VAALLCPSPALAQNGFITGIVRDAVTHAPIQTALVLCVEESSWCRGGWMTDGTGAYRAEISPGTYLVYTYGMAGGSAYVNEIFPDILCPGACDPQVALQSGGRLVVTPTATVRADFALDRGGAIAGTITDSQTSAPLMGIGAIASSLIDGQLVGSSGSTTDGSGRYVIEGLPVGRYYIRTYDSSTMHLDEVYDNIACGALCEDQEVVSGTPVTVVPGTTNDGRDFALDTGGRITGTVIDAVTTLPLSVVCVQVLAPLPTGVAEVFLRSDCTDATGTYEIVGVPAGNYLLIGEPHDSNYVPELYDGISCPGRSCDMRAGTLVPVTIGGTTSGRNFALEPGGTIHGTVRDAATGQASITGSVVVYSREGVALRQAGQATVDYATGAFEVPGLPAGTYYAHSLLFGYRNEIFDGVRCQAQYCSEQERATLGAPIIVTAGGSAIGVDFAVDNDLVPGPPFSPSAVVNGSTVSLSWGPPYTGGAPSGYILEAGAAPGATFVQQFTANTRFVVGGVMQGRYFVRVKAVNTNGIGPASEEFLVTVPCPTLPPVTAPVNLVGWVSGSRLTLTWGAPPSTAGITGYVVEAGSSTGLTNIARIGVNARSLTYIPVPAGYYFVRVRAMNANGLGPASEEVLINAGGVPAPPQAPRSLTGQVTGSAVTLAWQPADGESPSGYLLRAGSAPGLSNLAEVSTGPAERALTFNGVPAGVYYVRVHAVGSLGLGAASEEVTVIVR
jgi:hypothetical protein